MASRRAPPEVEAFLASYRPQVRALALRLRSLIIELAPDATEQVDLPARLIGYGFATTYKGTICVVMPLKNAVNLGFPRGTELSDPAYLLAGAGKRARHVRISDDAEAERLELRALLEESINLTKATIISEAR